jgi:hypothetical protein
MSEAEKEQKRREKSIWEQFQASVDGGINWKNGAVQVN